MERAEDTLIRFIKSSVKLLRPTEVEQKRVELMVRELLTVRPYSTSGQLLMRRVCVTVRHKGRKHTIRFSTAPDWVMRMEDAPPVASVDRFACSRSLHTSEHHKPAPFIECSLLLTVWPCLYITRLPDVSIASPPWSYDYGHA